MIFGVYTHATPQGEIFYVGKGTKKRAFHKGSGRGTLHRMIIKKYGAINIIVEFTPSMSEQQAFDKEKKLIAYFKAKGIKLVNKTDGGEGTKGLKRTLESNIKISIARKGIIFSPEHCKNISKSKKGKSTGPCKEETKKNISLAKKGKPMSQENKDKLSKALMGRKTKPPSEETRTKISQALLGRKFSIEHRNKLKEAKILYYKQQASTGLPGKKPVIKKQKKDEQCLNKQLKQT